MKWRINPLPVLLLASTLAMIGLVIFQYKWINHSKELYDEVFHQRACMALCSTLEEYGEGAICNNTTCESINSQTINSLMPAYEEKAETRVDLVNNDNFQSDLRKTLDFYNIDLNYKMTQSVNNPAECKTAKTATCIVNVPPKSEGEAESVIMLDFPRKQNYMLAKMKFMIGASIIILLFTAIVLLLANWWLLRQKRMLKMNVDMYNNMAHEFRTPLTNIQLASSMLSAVKENRNGQKFVDIISRENGKLIQQVERILHLARLDNGDFALRNEKIHLRTLLQNVLDEFEIRIEEKQAHVEMDQIPDHLEIMGDRQHLTNVFRNLLDNALKYSTTDPLISISIKDEAEGVVISIADNGIGVAASQNKLIFEKFQRVPHGNLHEQKGFGLGLAYVKKIVELHKGTVNLESELDKGSRFHVYLPKFC